MKRSYQFLLLLYPRGHRDRFAEEMLSVFEEAAAEGRAQGWAWHLRFALAEMNGLIAGAADAWFYRRPEPVVVAAQSAQPDELRDAQRRVDANIAAMVHAIANHQFEQARAYSEQERGARENLRRLREKYGIDS